ncbi:MAG: transcriptional regulator [Denitrovibrio sp.]|mgnify:CR=1 FL=1|nr:MAG: transcriptional regulator [Denitrovibrio sp.]
MPIYEYSCEKCGKVTEKLVSVTAENSEIDCPECNGKAAKIMSASAFHLKGSGWYAQGYSKESGCSAKKDAPACASCPAAKN